MEETIRTADLSDEELGRLGRIIYDHELREKLEPTHNGEFVVIHVVNGDYFVDRDEVEALDAALARYPGQVFYITRVGYDVADAFHTPERRESPAAAMRDLRLEGLRPSKP